MTEVRRPLVTIIMPTYNAELYIAEAVDSVLAQTYTNWELLLVNDGSTDGTAAVIERFSDPRIRVFTKPNGGIGSARNLALSHMRGEYLSFCDSDDTLPAGSVEARLTALLADPEASFADGVVHVYDRQLKEVKREYRPRFTGVPLLELVGMTGSCFLGCTWMIRLDPAMKLKFNTDVTHAEDLMFFMSIAAGRKYIHVDAQVYYYRVTGHSSMSNVEGLANSLRYLEHWMASDLPEVPGSAVRKFAWRRKRIIVGTYYQQRKYGKALKALFK